jgi:hypothetical protein
MSTSRAGEAERRGDGESGFGERDLPRCDMLGMARCVEEVQSLSREKEKEREESSGIRGYLGWDGVIRVWRSSWRCFMHSSVCMVFSSLSIAKV